MFEKIKYINHLNEEIKFGENGVFVNENELRDYSWNYSKDNNKISNFNRGVSKLKLPVAVACANEDEGISAINRLMEVAEKDVLAGQPGRFYVGEYYYSSYIIASKKKKHNRIRGFMLADLTVASDNPVWVKEIQGTFDATTSSAGKNLDFPHDCLYDFTSPNLVDTLVNTGFADVNFMIRIYGEVTNPSVTIGSHQYSVNTKVNSGEYLTIDSREKKVFITKADGTQENHFKDRDKSNYIFEKVPSGESKVSWSGEYVFDVTLYEERSEPKWI